MNTTRFYRLSKSALATLEVIDKNKSRVISTALRDLYDDHQIIVREMQERLNDQTIVVDNDMARVAVYMPVFVAGGLDDLVSRLRLPVEEVVRLAVDAFIRRQGKSHKASHEPAGPVQPASEGRNLN